MEGSHGRAVKDKKNSTPLAPPIRPGDSAYLDLLKDARTLTWRGKKLVQIGMLERSRDSHRRDDGIVDEEHGLVDEGVEAVCDEALRTTETAERTSHAVARQKPPDSSLNEDVCRLEDLMREVRGGHLAMVRPEHSTCQDISFLISEYVAPEASLTGSGFLPSLGARSPDHSAPSSPSSGSPVPNHESHAPGHPNKSAGGLSACGQPMSPTQRKTAVLVGDPDVTLVSCSSSSSKSLRPASPLPLTVELLRPSRTRSMRHAVRPASPCGPDLQRGLRSADEATLLHYLETLSDVQDSDTSSPAVLETSAAAASTSVVPMAPSLLPPCSSHADEFPPVASGVSKWRRKSCSVAEQTASVMSTRARRLIRTHSTSGNDAACIAASNAHAAGGNNAAAAAAAVDTAAMESFAPSVCRAPRVPGGSRAVGPSVSYAIEAVALRAEGSSHSVPYLPALFKSTDSSGARGRIEADANMSPPTRTASQSACMSRNSSLSRCQVALLTAASSRFSLTSHEGEQDRVGLVAERGLLPVGSTSVRHLSSSNGCISGVPSPFPSPLTPARKVNMSRVYADIAHLEEHYLPSEENGEPRALWKVSSYNQHVRAKLSSDSGVIAATGEEAGTWAAYALRPSRSSQPGCAASGSSSGGSRAAASHPLAELESCRQSLRRVEQHHVAQQHQSTLLRARPRARTPSRHLPHSDGDVDVYGMYSTGSTSGPERSSPSCPVMPYRMGSAVRLATSVAHSRQQHRTDRVSCESFISEGHLGNDGGVDREEGEEEGQEERMARAMQEMAMRVGEGVQRSARAPQFQIMSVVHRLAKKLKGLQMFGGLGSSNGSSAQVREGSKLDTATKRTEK